MESEPLSFPLLHVDDAIRRAEESLEQDPPESALQLLTELQRQFPGEGRLWWMGAQVLEETGRIDEAVSSYQRALDLDPGGLECALDLAELFFLCDRLNESRSLVTEVLLRSPESARATAMLGVVLRARGNPSESEAALRLALDLDPEYSWAARHLCDLLQDSGRFQEAQELVVGTLDRDPVDPYNHAYFGDLLLTVGRPDEAESAFRTALWLWPGYSWAARRLAQLLCRSDRLDEGRDVLKECLKHTPGDPWTLACLGCVERRGGDFPRAEDCFRQALVAEPELEVAFSGLLELLYQGDRLEEARELIRARPGWRCADQ